MDNLTTKKIKVISEPTKEKPFIVIYKPRNLPTAPLSENDKNNALFQAGELFPEIYNVTGKKNIEYGLLHRLDNITDGLVVIATTQECYDFLQNEQQDGHFIKYYTALCDKNKENNSILPGFPHLNIEKKLFSKSEKIDLTSYFRSYGLGKKEVRPVTETSGKAALKKLGKPKLYTTKIDIKKSDNDQFLVECCIKEGFRHQVRCHLAWAGLPIVGDIIYNSKYKTEIDKKNAENIKFSATKIQFEYPRGDLNSYEIALTWT